MKNKKTTKKMSLLACANVLHNQLHTFRTEQNIKIKIKTETMKKNEKTHSVCE